MVTAKAYQVAATPASFDDLSLAKTVDATVTKFELPVFMGAELGLTQWCKARGMVSRNFYSQDSSNVVTETFNSSGVSTGKTTSKTADDVNPAWTVAMGFGFYFGNFSWDTALNSKLLGSANGAAFVNPLYQSSFTYQF
jgi:hypothetical protein